MAKVWHLFSQEDRAILRFQLVQNMPKHANLHAGLLPFVQLTEIAMALDTSLARRGVPDQPYVASRRLKQLRNKLDAIVVGSRDKLLLKLDDGKVVKRFGVHPERGKPFPWLPPRAVKMQAISDHPMVSVDEDRISVAPCVALVPHGHRMWEVQCEAQYRQRIETWLLDYCR